MPSPSPRFEIAIIGAGLGGLATAISLSRHGHSVLVLESNSGLQEVGAGVQIPPSSSRILDSYGLTPALRAKADLPAAIRFRRYKTGEFIGGTKLDPDVAERYGFPYYTIHRADYQKLLDDGAVASGAVVRFGCAVQSVDTRSEKPVVTLVSGEVIPVDLVVGADGFRSRVRKAVLGSDIQPIRNRSCSYRAVVDSHLMATDRQVSHLLSDPNANCWIGPRRHIMGYKIRNGGLYNLVMSHPGNIDVGSKSNVVADLQEMRNQFHDFDPVIQRVLTYVKSGLKWQLLELPSLESWVSESGRVVLIGDAAHSMVPFLAQGAATAIEDSAVLGICISACATPQDIPRFLDLFAKLRKPRCEKISRRARENGDIWHTPDGEAQIARDTAMGYDFDHKREQANPNRWSDTEVQPWLFGYDAAEHAKFEIRRGGVSSAVLSAEEYMRRATTSELSDSAGAGYQTKPLQGLYVESKL